MFIHKLDLLGSVFYQLIEIYLTTDLIFLGYFSLSLIFLTSRGLL